MEPVPFGRYTLFERLGAGGMGEAFLAVERNAFGADRFVVIKRLLPSRSTNPSDVQMFLAEAKLGALLGHSNIVQLYDVGRHAGHYFIAIEYIHGVDLKELLVSAREAGVQLSFEFLVGVGVEVCRGLAFAHSRHGVDGTALEIVHRDISPANIALGASGEVKVIDFGVAKSALEPRTERLVTGKRSYMAPELAQGMPVDGRCDLYSLGVVLYELATHARPPSVSTSGEIASGASGVGPDPESAPVPPPRELRPDMPEDLEWILLKALAHRPEDRFADAQGMASALMELAREQGYDLGPHVRGTVLRSVVPPEQLKSPSVQVRARHAVLVVGRESDRRAELCAVLEESYRCLTADGHAQARARLESGLVDAVVVQSDGVGSELEFLRWMAETFPTTIRILLSADLGGEALVNAINIGRVDRIYALTHRSRSVADGLRQLLEESDSRTVHRSSAFPTVPPPIRRSSGASSAPSETQMRPSLGVAGWVRDGETLEREVSRTVEKHKRAWLILVELPLTAPTREPLSSTELRRTVQELFGDGPRVLMAGGGRFAVLLGEAGDSQAAEAGRELVGRLRQKLGSEATLAGILWTTLEVSDEASPLVERIAALEWHRTAAEGA